MKKFLLFIISLLMGVGLLVWILKMVGFEEIKESFAVFSWWKLMAIILLTFIIAALGIWKWREILKGEGASISFSSLISPYLAGYAVMLLAPIMIWGGEMLRGYIIKEKNQILWKKGIASVIIDKILEWTANSIVVIFGISIFISKIYRLPPAMELLFGSLFIFFAVIIFKFYLKVFKKESFIKGFARILGFKKIRGNNSFLEIEDEIFAFFHAKNRLMWNAISITFIKTGVMWLRAWLLIFFLGEAVGIFSGLSILGFNYLAVLVPIPAALGSHEAIQTFAFSALGLDRSGATAFTMIIRVAELLTAFIGLATLLRFGIYFIKKILFRKIVKITGGLQENNNQAQIKC